MERSSILVLTMLLSVLAVSQIERRDEGPDHQIRQSSGNVEDYLRRLCCGRGNFGFLVASVGQFLILDTGHVLAQTDRETIGDDINQPRNQEGGLGRLLIEIRWFCILAGAVAGFCGAFVILVFSCLSKKQELNLKYKPWQDKILFLSAGTIVGPFVCCYIDDTKRIGVLYALFSGAGLGIVILLQNSIGDIGRLLRVILIAVLNVPPTTRPTTTTDAPEPSPLTATLRLQLIEALLKIPKIQSFDGRTGLLDGIPSKDSLRRDQNIIRNDLEQIIDQLDRLGPLTTGKWPLLQLIENALPDVAGYTVGDDLKTMQQALTQGYVGV